MEIKEKKIMAELIFSEEEGDLLIKFYDIINELSSRNDNLCEPIEIFQNIVFDIQDQKNRCKEKYKIYVEDYYYNP